MNRKQLKVGTDYWHQEGRYAAPVKVRLLTLDKLVPVSRAKGGRVAKHRLRVDGYGAVFAYAMPKPYGYPYPVDSVLVAPVSTGRPDLSKAHLARVASLAGEWDTVKAERAAQAAAAQAETAAKVAELRATRERAADLHARLSALGVTLTRADLDALRDLAPASR